MQTVHTGKKSEVIDNNQQNKTDNDSNSRRQLWCKLCTECVCVRYLSGPSWIESDLSESLQTSSVKPETGREAQGEGTHMSLYQHPGEEEEELLWGEILEWCCPRAVSGSRPCSRAPQQSPGGEPATLQLPVHTVLWYPLVPKPSQYRQSFCCHGQTGRYTHSYILTLWH